MTTTHACESELHDRCLKAWCTCTCHRFVIDPPCPVIRLWRWLTGWLETGPTLPTRRERWPR